MASLYEARLKARLPGGGGNERDIAGSPEVTTASWPQPKAPKAPKPPKAPTPAPLGEPASGGPSSPRYQPRARVGTILSGGGTRETLGA